VLLKWTQIGVEIVIADQEYFLLGMIRIVLSDLIDQLQTHRRFSGSFGTKYDRCSGLLGVTDNLAPRGVKGPCDTKIAKDRIGLCVFVDEGVAYKLMMFEELLFGHGSGFRM
jgi:hypothetical protein